MPAPLPLPGTPDAQSTFRAKAEELVRANGGINAQSLALIHRVAIDLGLPPEHVATFLQNWGKAALSPRPSDPEIQRYADYVRRRLKTNPYLTAPLHAELMQKAGEYFRIDRGNAELAIERVAFECNCQIVKDEDVLSFLTRLIQEKTNAAGVVPWREMESIYRVGVQLGMPHHRVKAIVKQRDAFDEEGLRRQRDWEKRALIGGGLGLGALALILVIAILSKMTARPYQPPADEAAKKPATSASASAPAWQPDPELAKLVADAKKLLPTHEALLDKLLMPSPTDRADGYEKLVQITPRLASHAEAGPVIRQLLIVCFVGDPYDSPAQRLAEDLLRLVAPPTNETAGYDLPFWTLETAARSLGHSAITQPRANLMLAQLDKTLSTSIDRALKPDGLLPWCQAFFAERCYQFLTTQATGEPDKALRFLIVLRPKATPLVPPERRERLETDFLLAALAGLGTRKEWDKPGLDLIARCVNTKQADNVRRLIDFYEKTGDTPLKDHLERLLAERTKTDVTLFATRAQKATALRNAIGVEAALKAGGPADRSVRFIAVSKALLGAPPNPAAKPEVVLQDVVSLAHAATLACALAQEKSTALDTFDRLAGAGAPRLEAKKTEENAPPDPPDPPKRGALVPLEKSLVGLRASSQADRVLALQVIAGRGDVAGLLPQQAEEVARYIVLTAGRSVSELAAILDSVKKLAASRYVVLALADYMLAGEMTTGLAEKLVSAIYGQEVKLSTGFPWRQRCRQILLRHVLEQMDASNLYDQGADRLRELYRDQATLLGIGAQDLFLTPTNAPLLEAIINAIAKRLLAQKLDPADRNYLEKLPFELSAAQYLGRNDLQHFVLLQRVWLRVLAIHIAFQRPERAIEVKNLVKELDTEDAKATNLLQQMRSGEEKLLRAWTTLAVKR